MWKISPTINVIPAAPSARNAALNPAFNIFVFSDNATIEFEMPCVKNTNITASIIATYFSKNINGIIGIIAPITYDNAVFNADVDASPEYLFIKSSIDLLFENICFLFNKAILYSDSDFWAKYEPSAILNVPLVPTTAPLSAIYRCGEIIAVKPAKVAKTSTSPSLMPYKKSLLF